VSSLAFSIACKVHPEILVLDEVLSVMDVLLASEIKMKSIISEGVIT